MKPFFICSLPRSRTAWMANFLTYGQSYCFHEGLLGCNSIAALKRKMRATGKSVVGNSDCGNVLFIKRIMDAMPDSKLVVIRRDYDDVLASLERLGAAFSERAAVERSAELLEAIPRLYSSLVIDYDDLNQHGCRLIWEHCTGTDFDAERWRMLDGLRVEIDTDKKAAQLAEHETNLNELITEV